MLNPKLFGMIGLCNRAGRLVSGGFSVEKSVKSGKARLVLLDEGASENTKKELRALCEGKNVPLIELPSGELEKALGKFRMSAAVCDENFSSQILKYI